ncbi:MAG: hypothetical protein H6510_11185 [Acidobacteria bacterium]|nr:hypothetical protein [Acidobacteriota bacterium]MCB9398368.1 hypothetical protein [Acidobacteriota bacterium]
MEIRCLEETITLAPPPPADWSEPFYGEFLPAFQIQPLDDVLHEYQTQPAGQKTGRFSVRESKFLCSQDFAQNTITDLVAYLSED